MSKHLKSLILLGIAAILLMAGAGCSRTEIAESEVPAHSGQIYLYGEEHNNKKIMDEELRLWEKYYNENGMRDLFIEYPYYTAEFLNLWMKADDDAILDEVFNELGGTLADSEDVKDFYRSIKSNCPETVFHGTDIGHTYATTGERYLAYLRNNGQKESPQYTHAQEVIEQGRHYYRNGYVTDDVYREKVMVKNFMKEFEALNGVDIMGIYGSAHTDTQAMDYMTQSVPCMANQLKQQYGEALHSEDLALWSLDIEPLRMDKIEIAGKEYEAAYFGEADISEWAPEYKCREFWRIENAYDDFKDCATTGNVLPYDNFIMLVEEGQVFVIDYTKADGSVVREYHRTDGNIWQGLPIAEEFEIE